MTQFTLFKRPTRLVFLDDDSLFLDVLSVALPMEWRSDLYIDSQACLSQLKSNAAAWAQDELKLHVLLNKMQSADQGGMSAIPSILAYWRQNPARYDLVELATFDYAMPGLNGLDAFELLGDWPGRRVLLTGQADEVMAVKAFNKGTIQQFIAKQGGNLRDSLLFQLPHLLEQPLPQHQVLWHQSLSLAQQQWLDQPSVVQALNQQVKLNRWIEYAVTSLPFGLLGADAKGAVSWLQLECQSDLHELAELTREEGLTGRPLERIRSGALLANTELRLALGGSVALETEPAFIMGTKELPNGSTDTLLGAVWALGAAFSLDEQQAYAAWSERNPSRIYRDSP